MAKVNLFCSQYCTPTFLPTVYRDQGNVRIRIMYIFRRKPLSNIGQLRIHWKCHLLLFLLSLNSLQSLQHCLLDPTTAYVSMLSLTYILVTPTHKYAGYQRRHKHCSVQAVPSTFPTLLTASVLEYSTELSKGFLHY